MKYNFLRVLLLALLGFGLTDLQAQESVPATGSNASSSSGSVSYTVGQLVFSHKTGAVGSMTEGVQQPYEVQVITGIEDGRDITLSFTVYPNPTTDYLMLRAENMDLSTLHYQLYNLNGQLLKDQAMSGNESSVSMWKYASAIYYLKVLDHEDVVKTFKIIKN